MKYFEILLKVLFVGGAGYLYFSDSATVACFVAFAIVCLALGITLIFNKKQSYGYELAKREVVMRKIEGVILVLFVIVILYLLLNSTTEVITIN